MSENRWYVKTPSSPLFQGRMLFWLTQEGTNPARTLWRRCALTGLGVKTIQNVRGFSFIASITGSPQADEGRRSFRRSRAGGREGRHTLLGDPLLPAF